MRVWRAAPDEAPAVAALLAVFRDRWSVWWEADDCWLEDLYVRPEARGEGIGRALVEAVIGQARERGKTGGYDIFMRRRL